MDSLSRDTLRDIYSRLHSLESRVSITEAHDVGVRSNRNATAAPTAANNLSQGYGIGSEWVIPNVSLWKCIFANQATATWVQLHP